MIKLLICDDEPWICFLVRQLLDADRLGIQILEDVYDGETAYQRIVSKNPDIVITDIKMPGMDGLEMIEKVRRAGLNTRFVIVSGFGTFDYARKAIRYQVEDYLIKPINKTDVNEIVEKLCMAIHGEKESAGQIRKTIDDLNKSYALNRSFFLSNIIFNHEEIKNSNLEEVNEKYGFQFLEGHFLLGIINLLAIEKIHDSSGVKKMKDLLQSVFSEMCFECEPYIYRESIILLLNYAPEKEVELYKTFHHYIRKFSASPEYAGLFRTVVLLSEPVKEMDRIGDLYWETQELLPAGILRGYNCVCQVDETITCDPSQIIFKEQIREGIKKSCENELVKLLSSLLLELLTDNRSLIIKAPKLFHVLIREVVDYVGRLTERTETQKSALIKEIMDGYPECSSSEELSEFLAGKIYSVFNEYNRLKSANKNLAIQTAKQYIDQHYMENIAMEKVAQMVFLSPSYFSTLFKKELKLPFGDYLIEIRIKKAKEMLASNEYSVTQVAEMVGYKDAKYFSRIFCKKVGLKPLEYRRLRASEMETWQV